MKVNTIRFKFVVEDRDRHGNVRVYLRLPGQPKIRLQSEPGSVEFLAEYQSALAGQRQPKPKRSAPPAAGTLHALCIAYYNSDAFLTLSKRTQHVRRLVLDRLCATAGPDRVEHGKRLATEMLPAHVRAVRGPVDKPEAANGVVKALRVAFDAGIDAGIVQHNPARAVKLLPSKNPDGFHSWNAAEIEQYRAHHPVGSMARLAMELLLHIGCRREDVAAIGPAMIHDGRLHYTQGKNKRRKPVHLVVPIHRDLRAILDASPIGTETFVVSSVGRRYTTESFGNAFRDWCNEAGLPHCSAHGLRKAAAAKLAEAGATENEIKAVGGWKTSKEVTRYTAAASQKTMAESALARLSVTSKPAEVSHSEGGSSEWDETDSQPIEQTGADKWMVPRGGIEPPTLRFSVACSTN